MILTNSSQATGQAIKPLTNSQVIEIIANAETFDDEVIGDGTWGKVIALKDGSLLKLIHPRDNITQAQKKSDNEVIALKYFSSFKSKSFALPKLIGSGRAALNNYCAWLQLTQIEGRVLSEEYFEELAPPQQLKLGYSLGVALAELHNYARQHPCIFKSDTSAAINQLQSIEELIDSPLERKFYEAVLKALTDSSAVQRDVVIHGDIKFGNIIINEDMQVVGLIDFANVALDFKEFDFARLGKYPHFLKAVIDAYNKVAIEPVNNKLLHLAEAIDALIRAIIDVKVDNKETDGADFQRFKTSWHSYLKAN